MLSVLAAHVGFDLVFMRLSIDKVSRVIRGRIIDGVFSFVAAVAHGKRRVVIEMGLRVAEQRTEMDFETLAEW